MLRQSSSNEILTAKGEFPDLPRLKDRPIKYHFDFKIDCVLLRKSALKIAKILLKDSYRLEFNN